MKRIIILLFVFTLFNLQSLKADTIYFVDFSYILNQSKAGKGAQDFLKNKIKTENAKFNKLEKKILEDEKALIAKKKCSQKWGIQKTIDWIEKKSCDYSEKQKKLYCWYWQKKIRIKKEIVKCFKPHNEKLYEGD